MGRINKNITRGKLYEAFQLFMTNGDRSKITVSAIIAQAGMNRKTFYNHFATQDELAAWGFRHDLFTELRERFPDKELVVPSVDPYAFDDLPCYVRIPSGALSLDQSTYFTAARTTLARNEAYYIALLKSDLAEEFLRYLVDVLTTLFLEDIDYFLKGRKMPLWAQERIASFFAEGVIHHMADALVAHRIGVRENQDVAPLNNMVHESMRSLVETYQSEKSTEYFTRGRLI